MEEIKNWYVVYTKPKWEKKTASLLANRGIENYCPVHKVVRQWSDRKKTVLMPLFTSYVFIYAGKSQHTTIKDMDGVINFVYWLGQPAIIKDAEIEVIRTFLLNHENVRAEHTVINVRDKVRILTGAFSMKEGEIIDVRNHTVRISLPSLGYVLMADIEKVNVELVSSFKTLHGEVN